VLANLQQAPVDEVGLREITPDLGGKIHNSTAGCILRRSRTGYAIMEGGGETWSANVLREDE
jgi:hypothetical protein